MAKVMCVDMYMIDSSILVFATFHITVICLASLIKIGQK